MFVCSFSFRCFIVVSPLNHIRSGGSATAAHDDDASVFQAQGLGTHSVLILNQAEEYGVQVVLTDNTEAACASRLGTCSYGGVPNVCRLFHPIP